LLNRAFSSPFNFMAVDLSTQRTHDTAPWSSEVRSPRLDCDVAIVGGGVVGMTLACALGQTGLRVMAIDAQTMPEAANRQNVYAISLLSGRIFTGLGVWDQILPRISTFSRIVLSDGDRAQRVTFQPPDLGAAVGGKLGIDHLGYVAEHQPILEALHAQFGDRETLSLIAPAQVRGLTQYDDRAELTLEVEGQTQIVTAQLVVAADGARSQLRQAAGITQTGWKYWQSCVTFKVKPSQSHQNIAYEKFRTQGPFAILPLTGDRCNVVWTLPHAEAQAVMALDEAAFKAAMREQFGDQMGDLEIISPRRLFPVQLMQSQQYVCPRLVLVGDAAHCCHPVGGQGVNLGIRDAAALAEVLSDAYGAGEDLGSIAVLKRYERWRKLENWVVLGFTDLLDRLFSNEIWPLVLARQIGFWGLTAIAPLRRLALQLMTGGLGRQPQVSLPTDPRPN
jgi:2-octaprenyl-6-methoxyphenol hydroxylase